MLALLSVIAIACMVSTMLLAGTAYANKELESPVEVSDDITRLEVNKLDKDTHEQVSGANMAIVERDTGVVVDEWVTDGTTHKIEKTLDVGVTYVLRELSAPDKYEVAADTEFVIKPNEGEGIDILSGGSAEQTEAYKVAIYDAPKSTTVETEVVQDNETSGKKSATTKTVAPKTGDETPMSLVLILVACGVLAIAILQIVKVRLAKRQS